MSLPRTVDNLRRARFLSVAMALGINASPGLAQNAESSAASSSAASTTADTGQLEEVIITAQKRTERLQDIPVAAQVISSQALADANVADLSDLNNLVPSVELNGTINGRVPTGIRGISSVSNEGTVGISSGVAIMIDGVPVPSDSFSANNVMGIQNVEVLLGPQSTLGGRTAASGLINFTTRGPTDTPQGFANATVTTDGEYRIEGFLSGPIVDRIEGSLDAYRTTVPYPITNLTLHQTSSVDIYGVRAKLKVAITDDLDATFMVRDSNSVGQGFNFTYLYITPGNHFLFPGSPFTQSLMLPGLTLGWKNLDYTSPVSTAGSNYRDTDYSGTLEYRLPAGYTLTSTSAYTQENQHQVQDLFAVNEYFWQVLTGSTVFNNTQQQINQVRQTSEELKIVSPVDLPVSWLAGFFYSDSTVDNLGLRSLPPAEVDNHVVPTTSTYDLYARSTWKLLRDTSLVTGLRFNHDIISYHYFQGVPGPYNSEGSAANNTLVGDIALKQQFTQDLMGYLGYSRGYSPGAYNTAALLSSNGSLAPVSRENIDSFEVGSKGTYLNGTLTLNGDVFDTIYTHYQIQGYSYTPGELAPPLMLSAAGKAETHGLELNADWLATPTTRVGFGAAYILAKFTDYKSAPCWGAESTVPIYTLNAQPPAGLCGQYYASQNGTLTASGSPYQNVTGDVLPNSPKFKGNLAIEQRLPLANHPYEWVLGANYIYRTSAQMLPDQNPYAIQSGFGLLNLNAAFRRTDGRFSVTFFLKNVTDHVYYSDVEDFWSGLWATGKNGSGTAVIGQPARDARRYGGITLSANL
jgi:iron complex outermembrane recepter protein